MFVRPRDLGTRHDEARRPLPGDGSVADARTVSTMAITIRARPERVFPWLVQMGSGRAGWYSFDRLDNGGVASARRIDPAWQQLGVGDRVPARPSGTSWFDVVALEPARVLVLRASLAIPSGRSLTPRQPRPRWFSECSWAFVLEPEGEDTRLLVRLRVAGAPRTALAIGNALVLGPGHVVMQRRQLGGIRARAELSR